MIEWLAVWGVTQAFGFVFKSIFVELAQDAAKDYIKDFFKQCFGEAVSIFEKDLLKEAYGKALKEFLDLVQRELEDADFQEIQIKQFIDPLKAFIKNAEVAEVLGSAFDLKQTAINTSVLAKTWQSMNLPTLPEEFDWDKLGKRYHKKAKAILTESEKLRPLLEISMQDIATKSVQELAGIIPDFDLKKYAEGLKEQYGNLRLDSLDTSGFAYNKLRLWKIFVAQNVRECQEFLPQVYDIPKDRLKKLQEQGEIDEIELEKAEPEQLRHRYVNQSPRSVLEMLAELDKKYVVILGDPGSGKSTLLQYLALDWAEKPIRELPAYPLPLFIELRLYARDKATGKCNSFLEFLHQGNVTCRLNQLDLDQKLRDGNVIALFDGVDEVFDPQLQEEIVTDIHRFTNDYDKIRVVITSRYSDYKNKQQRLKNAGFQHFMLQDFEDEQITTFIEIWHELAFGADQTDQIDRERKEARLKKAMTDSKAIKQLAVNPLLLTMMAILNRYQELPRDRTKLYERASEVLLHQWDVERNLIDKDLDPKTIDISDKQTILRKVADHMQSSRKGLAGNMIATEELKQILVTSLKEMEVQNPKKMAGVMLDQLRHRNFILCFLGADSYAFIHRTFLEYFCADAFVKKFEKTKQLNFEELWEQTFEAHWHEETWAEVLHLIAGMIDPEFTGKIIEKLMAIDGENFSYKNIFFASECLSESKKSSNNHQLSQKLKKEIEELIEFRFDNLLMFPDYIEDAKIIRMTAVQYLGLIWQESTDNFSIFQKCVQGDEDTDVRIAAIHELVHSFKSQPKTFPWLKEIAENDEDCFVREAAIWEIANGWKHESETLHWLKEIAQNDEDWVIRQAIVQSLARWWKNDPETLLILKKCVNSPENYHVRQIALLELIDGWKNDPDILLLVKKCAKEDDNWIMRLIAMDALIKLWKDNTKSVEYICEIALKDPFNRDYYFDKNPRQIALEILVKFYRESPRILEVFQDRAVNDPDEQVRDFAKEHLEKLKLNS